MIFRIAVCSNSLRDSLAVMLTATNLIDLVDLYLGNDDAAPKPAPDLYQTAAERLGVPLKRSVVVEDSVIGLQAAYAADPRGVIHVKDPSEVHMGLIPVIVEVFESDA